MKCVASLAVGSAFLAAGSAFVRAETCGDLLIVLDRSGSMAACKLTDGATKEDVAKKAIKAVVANYPAIPMGLMVFPDTGAPDQGGECAGVCSPGVVKVDVAADAATYVIGVLDSMPRSCGGTPTGATLQAVKEYGHWLPDEDHYVLLITDGVPTCDDGMNPSGPCDGGGCSECTNPTKAYSAIEEMCEQHDIRTFVVGFDTTKAECPAPPSSCGAGNPLPPGPVRLNANTLNRMAELGGEWSTGDTRYYSADDETSLKAALSKILGKFQERTPTGCYPARHCVTYDHRDTGDAGDGDGSQVEDSARDSLEPGASASSGPGCGCAAPGDGPTAGLPIAAATALAAWAAHRRRRRRERGSDNSGGAVARPRCASVPPPWRTRGKRTSWSPGAGRRSGSR